MDNSEQSITQEIRLEMRREMDNLRHELGQVRSLVQDAIVKLTNSFEGLRDQSMRQKNLVAALVTSLEQGNEGENGQSAPHVNIRQFVAETDQILRSFVDHIVLVSRQSMEMVHRVDDLSSQMNEIVALVKDVRAVAEQTNVLALNARIVAARAGDAGKAFAVVADEVRKLSKDSRRASDRIDTVVENSQESIQLAQEIIAAMASKDMSFAIQSKGRVDDMMNDVTEIDRFTTTTLSEVANVTANIQHSVGVAVMSLQFEDMVTQLIANMERKFAVTEHLVEGLCCACTGKEGHGTSSVGETSHLRQKLIDQKRMFDEADRKAVRQDSMDEGDIELF